MKVVLVNHSDSLGGASVVTFRLMQALRRVGVDARMLVTSKASDSFCVEVAAPRWRARLPFLAEHLEIFARNGFSRRDLFKASIATVGLPLSRHPLVKEADIVVLNWVNQGMLSLDEITRIAAVKPVVWTMHDMWNITGICHHAGNCDRYLTQCYTCPLLNSCAGKRDLSQRTFERKSKLYARAGIHFVAVSSWLADCARRSTLLADQHIELIHNPFSIDEFKAESVMNRSELGLPEQGRIVLMCAARIDDPVKGLSAAIEAFNALKSDNVIAVFVGDMRDPHALDGLRLPYHHLGPVYDSHRLRSIFAHSSVVLSSSSYESFGATLIEGQIAGATPVGFVHDGRADIITDGKTGYAANERRNLAESIDVALQSPIDRSQLAAAARRYSYDTIARKYLNLFDSII